MKPRISNPFRSGISAIIATITLSCFAAPSAFAAIATWTGAGTTGQWNIGTWANFGGTQATGGNDVVFGSIDPVTWTLTSLGGNRNIASLTFEAGSPAYDIRLTGGTEATNVYNLTFDSGNTGITIALGDLSSHTIGQAGVGGNVVLARNLTVTHNGSGTLSFDRPITGAGFGLTKDGTGTMRLSGANTYDGATQVNGGILVFAKTAAKASGTVTAGASGIIGLGVGGTGFYSAANLASLSANTLAGFSLDPTSGVAIDTTAANLTAQNGAIVGTRSLTKLGDGIAQLNQTNSYTGATIIKQGTLNLGAGAGGGKFSPDSAITIETGADFGIFQNDTVVQGVDFSSAPITGGGNFGIVGSPTVTLNAANSYTGTTTISGGLLKHEGSADLTLTSGNLTFDGPTTVSTPFNIYAGVLGLNSDFTRSLGTGDNQVQWIKSGGFAAFGADRTVSLNGGGNVAWNAGSFVPSSRGLVLGHTTATHKVTFSNNINFNNSNLRVIQVADGAAAVDAAISGTLGISGGALGGFVKTGDGTLELTNESLYTGTTNVSAGTLRLSHLSALGATSGITLSDGTLLQPAFGGITLSAPITTGAAATIASISAPIDLPGGGVVSALTLAGAITGAGDVTFTSSVNQNALSTVLLNAQSNYAGATLITRSGVLTADSGTQTIVKLGIANALPTTTVVTIDGGDGDGTVRFTEINLNGFDQELAGLTNVTRSSVDGSVRQQRIVNSDAAAHATLTINNAVDYTYSAHLGGGANGSVNSGSTPGSTNGNNFSLVKSGVGKFTLGVSSGSGAIAYAGNTTVNVGILSLERTNVNNESSTITIAATGATLDLAFAGTDTVDKLFIGATQMAAGEYKAVGSVASGTELAQLSGTGTLTVTSGPSGGGYSSWASLNGAGVELDGDHDGDGVSNGVEYFIGGPNGNTTGFTALPGVTNTGGTLSVTWTHAADYTGVYGTDFVVETSATLVDPWTTETEGVNVIITGNNVTYTFPAGTKNFARLKVTGP